MLKKITVCLLIVLSLVSFSAIGYATNVVDATKYEILNPEKSAYSTRDKIILINGKAPSGTEVTIEVYGTTDITLNDTNNLSKQGFNLDNLPTETDYILKATEKVTSGNMGLFLKQLDLVKGINKIVINFGTEGIEPVEKIVYVYNRVKATAQEPRITNVLPLLR